MKNKRLTVLFLGIALIVSLLSACGGGSGADATTAAGAAAPAQASGTSKTGSQKDGTQAAPGTQASEATVNASDFYGIWEYTDTYNWICIYGDGTYEWYDNEGLTENGGYTMDGAELHLNESGLFYCLDGEGGLIDSDGDTLFASELPAYENMVSDPVYEDDGKGGSDPGDYGVIDFANAGDFYGTWESSVENRWLVIYSDGTFTQYYEDGSYDIGTYYIDEGELCFDVLSDRYFYKDATHIESVNGEEMFASEVPRHILEGYGTQSFADDNTYYGSDPGDGGDDPYGSDPGDGGYVDVSSDYWGTWERSDSQVWYTINSDGSYKMIYWDGDFLHGTYWMNGYQLVFEDGSTLDLYQGNLVDGEGNMYYPSVEPF